MPIANNFTYEIYKDAVWYHNPTVLPEELKPVKLEFKAEWANPKPKKKKEIIAPNGYRLITDENYIIQESDKFYIGGWGDHIFVDMNNFLGKVIGNKLGAMMDMFKNEGGFYIASKEPRFKDAPAYPWGY